MDNDLPPPGWKPEKNPFLIGMEKHLSAAALNAPVSHEHFYGMVGDLIEELKALRTKVKELQDRPQMKYLGIWNQEKLYGEGVFITHDGSMWHAQRATIGERPGNTDSWVLAVKRGRPGK